MSRHRSPAATSRRSGQLRRRLLRSPPRVIATATVLVLASGTAVLCLPAASASGTAAPLSTAVFTAGSALSVTGLVVVDTATYWSPLGHITILALIETGGLGTMTLASLLVIILVRRLALRSTLLTGAALGSISIADTRSVVVGVVRAALVIQGLVAAALTLRLVVGHGYPPGRALAHGVFHAGSAFNNAGFALHSDNLMGFAHDPWVLAPIALAVILGGVGFPVLLELRHHLRTPQGWSLSTRLVLLGSSALLVTSTAVLTALEWRNPATLGPLAWPTKLLVGFFSAVVTRTAGFNAVDVGEMTTQSWFTQDVFMFIGAGPASTAGGVKITTVLVLLALVATEIRGERSVTVLDRRVARAVQRQATTVVTLAGALVVAATWTLLLTTMHPLDEILFEVISAFGTVGLSTGITAELPTGGQLMLVGLMFFGRLGPITLVSALALRRRPPSYERPRDRPIIG